MRAYAAGRRAVPPQAASAAIGAAAPAPSPLLVLAAIALLLSHAGAVVAPPPPRDGVLASRAAHLAADLRGLLAPPATSREGGWLSRSAAALPSSSSSPPVAASFLQVSAGAGIPFLEQGRFVGRGRGRGRAKVTYGPEEFDSSWWLSPPSVGPDSFLRGYDQRVYPHGTFGYGGMPNGGFGSGSLFWGGPTYHNAMNVPWFHDMGFNAHPKNVNAMYTPYLDLADTFGRKHGGGLFPLSSPYISFPPPLQGDWNLPHSPNMMVAPP